ncbi:hypothetical protein F7Q99_27320 [Streptomyces kaniharaensis]|uniref:Uncharacterized protein n=1 Tax=Streptomyces kaniharaensis TaxID=212423 RepID=A0A6N7KWH6_9ACTN|nr:hypothetical protein [Streptomyces kaniharaensis]MQS15870.1 hypothetical protein [Streptomyces kaniharaensis]
MPEQQQDEPQLTHDDAERSLAMLRHARAHHRAATGWPNSQLIPLVFEAFTAGGLSIDVIAVELNIAEDRVRAVIDGHMLFAYRVDLQTTYGWEVDDYVERAPVEIVDIDPTRNAEQFAQTTADEVLAGHDPDVINVRVLVWAVRPGRDEDAAAVVERSRS